MILYVIILVEFRVNNMMRGLSQTNFLRQSPIFICVSLFLLPGVWAHLVCESCQIVHAGVQRNGDALTLLKGIVSLATFYFGVVTLIDAGHHLHLHLCKAPAFSQFFQSAH